MTTEHTLPRTIRAEVSEEALTRVSRMFDSTQFQRVTEVLQNARRAGATAIEIQTDEDRTSVRDNGFGITDPGMILRMGASGWQKAETLAEDPAGMGIFALATSGCRIQSAPSDGPGWEAELTPRSFEGEEVEIRPWARPNGPGTIVSWPGKTKDWSAEMAARYLPVTVTLNGQPAEQTDYLAGSIYETSWEGFRIGVFASVFGNQAARKPGLKHELGMNYELNFHGLVINGFMPRLTELEGPLADLNDRNRYHGTSEEVWRVRVTWPRGGDSNCCCPHASRSSATSGSQDYKKHAAGRYTLARYGRQDNYE